MLDSLPRSTARGEIGDLDMNSHTPSIMPPGSQRHLFDVPEDVVHFNTANMSPLLRRVPADLDRLVDGRRG